MYRVTLHGHVGWVVVFRVANELSLLLLYLLLLLLLLLLRILLLLRSAAAAAAAVVGAVVAIAAVVVGLGGHLEWLTPAAERCTRAACISPSCTRAAT